MGMMMWLKALIIIFFVIAKVKQKMRIPFFIYVTPLDNYGFKERNAYLE